MELNYNRVHLCGQAEDVPALSHVNHGCAFYRFTLAVMRLSGQADRLPVIVPQTLLHAVPVAAGAPSPSSVSCGPSTTKAVRAAAW